MLASHFILAPLAMEKFALQAISGLQQNIAAAQEVNKRLHFLGYVVNQYDARRGMHKGNLTKLRRTHGDQVLETTLSNLNAYSEAQMLRTPITHFDRAGRAATDTIALFNEVISRMEAHMKKLQSTTKQQTARRVA